jgi:hypothetical protein
MAGSHVRKSRTAGTWLAAMCGLPAFLLYTHTHNPGTCIRDTTVPGLCAATPGRVILTSITRRALARGWRSRPARRLGDYRPQQVIP